MWSLPERGIVGWFFLLDNVAINRRCLGQRMGELPGRRVVSRERGEFSHQQHGNWLLQDGSRDETNVRGSPQSF